MTRRKPGNAPAVHVKLSSLLGLHGWDIKQRYFDPQFRAGHRQVDVIIDCGFYGSPAVPSGDG